MFELTLVILMVAALLAVQWVMQLSLPSSTLTETGLLLLAAGIIGGIPAGFYYHILLYRRLRPRNQLPPGWWISPSRCHVHLSETERRQVRRWFRMGGIGFLLCIVGGLTALAGLAVGTF